jgi:hypothetical protein
MRMQQITLQFETPQDLAGFRKLVQTSSFEINIRELTMICDCTPSEIAIALKTYGAKVIQNKEMAG